MVLCEFLEDQIMAFLFAWFVMRSLTGRNRRTFLAEQLEDGYIAAAWDAHNRQRRRHQRIFVLQ